jgi:hypothetical protein
MGKRIQVYLNNNYDRTLAPVPADRYPGWFDDNSKTVDHARHCLPLAMASSLGYYILSPGTFMVSWDGNTQSNAKITHIDKSSHYIVDDHAAFGSFTVSAQFIPVTDDPGDFVMIKNLPNMRGLPYTCMEAMIEAWWSVANFGLVFMLNQPGEFIINKGQPIAQMCLYHGLAGSANLEFLDGYPQQHQGWLKKRRRPGYKKDLDYMKGKTHDNQSVPYHITNWKDALKFEEINDGQ